MLCVDAIIEIPESEGIKHLPVLEKEISVKINPKYQIIRFVTSNWRFIMTSIIALVVAIVAVLKYLEK
jgi:hypothetical protein